MDGASHVAGFVTVKTIAATVPTKRTAPRLYHRVPANPKKFLVNPITIVFPGHGNATARAIARMEVTRRIALALSARFVFRTNITYFFFFFSFKAKFKN